MPTQAQIKTQSKAYDAIVRRRRSVRRFTDESIPEEVVQQCLDHALLAPNSSNLQMWNFYRIVDPAKKRRMSAACLNQQAAKSAAELIVATANIRNWRKHSSDVIKHWPQDPVPKIARDYYEKLTYVQYGTVPLDPLGIGGRAKKALRDLIGLAQPMMRSPNDDGDLQVWAAKSVALACENIMLGFVANGFDTCPMEGFDEARVKNICGYGRGEFTVMVIAAGRRHEKGIYHDQFRFERERFVHEL